MKKLITACFSLLITSIALGAEPIQDCKCKSIPLYGRVKIVQHHANFNVKIVQHHARLHVKYVTSHPNACGHWQIVDSHPDFTIRFVDSHPDFTIRIVDSFPGEQNKTSFQHR